MYTLPSYLLSIFLIMLLLLLLILKILKLTNYQTSQLLFGGFFMFLYFGVFKYFLMIDIDNNYNIIINGFIISILFMYWYYLTYKITNVINTDNNNHIHFI